MTTQPSWVNTFLFPHFLRNKKEPFVLLFLVVCVLSLLPQKSFPKVGFTRMDLIVHVLMYSSLAYTLSLALYRCIWVNEIVAWKYPFILGSVGLGIEILQDILPFNRYFSWGDAVSNSLGACSFFVWVKLIRRYT